MRLGELTRMTFLSDLCADRPAAFRRWLEIYVPMLVGWLLRRGIDYATAHDICQEVVLVVRDKISSFERKGEGAFRAWLFGITIRKLSDHFRRLEKENDLAVNVADEVRARAGVDFPSFLGEPSVSEPRNEPLLRCLDLLGERDKKIVWEVVVNGQPPKVVAEQFKMTVGNVRKVKSRAFAEIRKNLGPDYFSMIR